MTFRKGVLPELKSPAEELACLLKDFPGQSLVIPEYL
jgi:hypothetical protein